MSRHTTPSGAFEIASLAVLERVNDQLAGASIERSHTMSEQMDFADGKYTVINDNGNLTALRNGEPWGRDLVGDNLVYWMLVEALRLKAQRDELLATLKEVLQWIDDNCETTGFESVEAQADAAIANVEGDKS
jgi:hypothetical protein